MPINIPSGLYTGGRARLDLTPMVNTILKNRAAKKAASDAIIKNAQDQLSKINTSGIRQVDLEDYQDPATGQKIPGINSLMNQFKMNSIASGTTDTETYNKILSAANQSKRRLEFIDDVQKAEFDGKLNSSKLDVNFFANLNKSVFDPTSKRQDGAEYSWADLPAAIPDIKGNELESVYKLASQGLPKNINPNLTTKDPTAGVVTTVAELSQNDIRNAANSYSALSQINPSISKFYAMAVDDDNFKKTYQPDFVKYFGKVIETPQEAAMAQGLSFALNDKKTDTRRDPEIEKKAREDSQRFQREQQARAQAFQRQQAKDSRAFQEKLQKRRDLNADQKMKAMQDFQNNQRILRENFQRTENEKYRINVGDGGGGGGGVDPFNLNF